MENTIKTNTKYKNSINSCFFKTVSIFTLGAFIFTSVLGDTFVQVANAQQIVPEAINVSSRFTYRSEINVPENLGTIDIGFRGPGFEHATCHMPHVINRQQHGDSSLENKTQHTTYNIRHMKDQKPTLIHIQDAHCNYDAQIKIAELIKYLNEKYEIGTINLEGGEGNYDLSIFTGIKDEKLRKSVTDYFVKEGVLNGAEWYAANNPDKLTLWGVEDTDLYLKNLNVYREYVEHKDLIDENINILIKKINQIKLEIFSKELIDLDKNYAGYKTGAITLDKYIGFLVENAEIVNVNTKKYEHLYALHKSFNLSEKIDFKRANIERSQLIDILEKMLSRNEVETLVRKTVDYKNNSIPEDDFYKYLLDRAYFVNIDLNYFSEFKKYVEYHKAYKKVDKSRIISELNGIEIEIKEKSFENNDQRILDELSRNLVLIKNMFNLTLTREDYDYFKKNSERFSMEKYSEFIKNNSLPDNNEFSVSGDLDEHIKKMSKFYEYSFQRDKVFIENLRFSTGSGVRGPGSGEEKVTVLITGGFHKENLASLCASRGINFISICPNFKNEEEYESPYFKLISGKNNNILEYINTGDSNLALYSDFCQNAKRIYGDDIEKKNKIWVELVQALIEGDEYVAGEIGEESDMRRKYILSETLHTKAGKGSGPTFSGDFKQFKPIEGCFVNGKQVLVSDNYNQRNEKWKVVEKTRSSALLKIFVEEKDFLIADIDVPVYTYPLNPCCALVIFDKKNRLQYFNHYNGEASIEDIMASLKFTSDDGRKLDVLDPDTEINVIKGVASDILTQKLFEALVHFGVDPKRIKTVRTKARFSEKDIDSVFAYQGEFYKLSLFNIKALTRISFLTGTPFLVFNIIKTIFGNGIVAGILGWLTFLGAFVIWFIMGELAEQYSVYKFKDKIAVSDSLNGYARRKKERVEILVSEKSKTNDRKEFSNNDVFSAENNLKGTMLWDRFIDKNGGTEPVMIELVGNMKEVEEQYALKRKELLFKGYDPADLVCFSVNVTEPSDRYLVNHLIFVAPFHAIPATEKLFVFSDRYLKLNCKFTYFSRHIIEDFRKRNIHWKWEKNSLSRNGFMGEVFVNLQHNLSDKFKGWTISSNTVSEETASVVETISDVSDQSESSFFKRIWYQIRAYWRIKKYEKISYFRDMPNLKIGKILPWEEVKSNISKRKILLRKKVKQAVPIIIDKKFDYYRAPEFVPEDWYMIADMGTPLWTDNLITCCAISLVDKKNKLHYLGHYNPDRANFEELVESFEYIKNGKKVLDIHDENTEIYIVKGSKPSKYFDKVIESFEENDIHRSRVNVVEIVDEDDNYRDVVAYNGKFYLPGDKLTLDSILNSCTNIFLSIMTVSPAIYFFGLYKNLILSIILSAVSAVTSFFIFAVAMNLTNYFTKKFVKKLFEDKIKKFGQISKPIKKFLEKKYPEQNATEDRTERIDFQKPLVVKEKFDFNKKTKVIYESWKEWYKITDIKIPLMTKNLFTCSAVIVVDRKNKLHYMGRYNGRKVTKKDFLKSLIYNKNKKRKLDIHGKDTKFYIVKGSTKFPRDSQAIYEALLEVGIDKENIIPVEVVYGKDSDPKAVVTHKGRLYVPGEQKKERKFFKNLFLLIFSVIFSQGDFKYMTPVKITKDPVGIFRSFSFSPAKSVAEILGKVGLPWDYKEVLLDLGWRSKADDDVSKLLNSEWVPEKETEQRTSDSLGIYSAEISREGLGCKVKLISGNKKFEEGEISLDLGPEVLPEFIENGTHNLSNTLFIVELEIPDSFKGRTGFQVFSKSAGWKSQYSNEVRIGPDSENVIKIPYYVSTRGSSFEGYSDKGYDPTRIIQIGLKIALDPKSDMNNIDEEFIVKRISVKSLSDKLNNSQILKNIHEEMIGSAKRVDEEIGIGEVHDVLGMDWLPETQKESLGIVSAEKTFWGLESEFEFFHGNKKFEKGEIYIDLRNQTLPGFTGQGMHDLTDLKFIAEIKMPRNLHRKAGFQIFSKDVNGNSQYSRWFSVNFEGGNTLRIPYIPSSRDDDPQAFTSEGYDPTKVLQIGIKLALDPVTHVESYEKGVFIVKKATVQRLNPLANVPKLIKAKSYLRDDPKYVPPVSKEEFQKRGGMSTYTYLARYGRLVGSSLLPELIEKRVSFLSDKYGIKTLRHWLFADLRINIIDFDRMGKPYLLDEKRKLAVKDIMTIIRAIDKADMTIIFPIFDYGLADGVGAPAGEKQSVLTNPEHSKALFSVLYDIFSDVARQMKKEGIDYRRVIFEPINEPTGVNLEQGHSLAYAQQFVAGMVDMLRKVFDGKTRISFSLREVDQLVYWTHLLKKGDSVNIHWYKHHGEKILDIPAGALNVPDGVDIFYGEAAPEAVETVLEKAYKNGYSGVLIWNPADLGWTKEATKSIYERYAKWFENFTREDRGKHHPFRFPRYIWAGDETHKGFKDYLKEYDDNLYQKVKEHGLAWTDDLGQIHWIDEKLNKKDAKKVWGLAKKAINQHKTPGRKLKKVDEVKNVIKFHESVHVLFRNTKYKKLISHFRTKLEEEVFKKPLFESHPFILSFRSIYGEATLPENYTNDPVDWYLQEFLVLSIQENELFGNMYEVIERVINEDNKDVFGFTDTEIAKSKTVLDWFLRESLKMDNINGKNKSDRDVRVQFPLNPDQERADRNIGLYYSKDAIVNGEKFNIDHYSILSSIFFQKNKNSDSQVFTEDLTGQKFYVLRDGENLGAKPIFLQEELYENMKSLFGWKKESDFVSYFRGLLDLRGDYGFEGENFLRSAQSSSYVFCQMDSSESGFEDHLRYGFIGVNRILFEKFAEDLEKDEKIKMRKMLLAVGISHGLSLEGGEPDKIFLTREDALLVKALSSSENVDIEKFYMECGKFFDMRIMYDARDYSENISEQLMNIKKGLESENIDDVKEALSRMEILGKSGILRIYFRCNNKDKIEFMRLLRGVILKEKKKILKVNSSEKTKQPETKIFIEKNWSSFYSPKKISIMVKAARLMAVVDGILYSRAFTLQGFEQLRDNAFEAGKGSLLNLINTGQRGRDIVKASYDYEEIISEVDKAFKRVPLAEDYNNEKAKENIFLYGKWIDFLYGSGINRKTDVYKNYFEESENMAQMINILRRILVQKPDIPVQKVLMELKEYLSKLNTKERKKFEAGIYSYMKVRPLLRKIENMAKDAGIEAGRFYKKEEISGNNKRETLFKNILGFIPEEIKIIFLPDCMHCVIDRQTDARLFFRVKNGIKQFEHDGFKELSNEEKSGYMYDHAGFFEKDYVGFFPDAKLNGIVTFGIRGDGIDDESVLRHEWAHKFFDFYTNLNVNTSNGPNKMVTDKLRYLVSEIRECKDGEERENLYEKISKLIEKEVMHYYYNELLAKLSTGKMPEEWNRFDDWFKTYKDYFLEKEEGDDVTDIVMPIGQEKVDKMFDEVFKRVYRRLFVLKSGLDNIGELLREIFYEEKGFFDSRAVSDRLTAFLQFIPVEEVSRLKRYETYLIAKLFDKKVSSKVWDGMGLAPDDAAEVIHYITYDLGGVVRVKFDKYDPYEFNSRTFFGNSDYLNRETFEKGIWTVEREVDPIFYMDADDIADYFFQKRIEEAYEIGVKVSVTDNDKRKMQKLNKAADIIEDILKRGTANAEQKMKLEKIVSDARNGIFEPMFENIEDAGFSDAVRISKNLKNKVSTDMWASRNIRLMDAAIFVRSMLGIKKNSGFRIYLENKTKIDFNGTSEEIYSMDINRMFDSIHQIKIDRMLKDAYESDKFKAIEKNLLLDVSGVLEGIIDKMHSTALKNNDIKLSAKVKTLRDTISRIKNGDISVNFVQVSDKNFTAHAGGMGIHINSVYEDDQKKTEYYIAHGILAGLVKDHKCISDVLDNLAVTEEAAAILAGAKFHKRALWNMGVFERETINGRDYSGGKQRKSIFGGSAIKLDGVDITSDEHEALNRAISELLDDKKHNVGVYEGLTFFAIPGLMKRFIEIMISTEKEEDGEKTGIFYSEEEALSSAENIIAHVGHRRENVYMDSDVFSLFENREDLLRDIALHERGHIVGYEEWMKFYLNKTYENSSYTISDIRTESVRRDKIFGYGTILFYSSEAKVKDYIASEWAKKRVLDFLTYKIEKEPKNKTEEKERIDIIEDRREVINKAFGNVNRKPDAVRIVVGVPQEIMDKEKQSIRRYLSRMLSENGYSNIGNGKEADLHQVELFAIGFNDPEGTRESYIKAMKTAEKDLTSNGRIILFAPQMDNLKINGEYLSSIARKKDYKQKEHITVINDAYSDFDPYNKHFPDIVARIVLARHIAFYFNGNGKMETLDNINWILSQMSDVHIEIKDLEEWVKNGVMNIRPIEYQELVKWIDLQKQFAKSA